MKGDSKDKKDFKIKKTPNTSITNYNSSGNSQLYQSSQTGQILGQLKKKGSYLC